MEQTLDISWETIGKVLLAGFVLYILFLAREVIVWFFFALVISLLLQPVIDFFRWMRLPRIVSVVVVYLLIFGILGLIIYLCAPIFSFEIQQLSAHIPEYFEKVNTILKDFGIQAAHNFDDFMAMLVTGLKDSSASVLQAVITFFGGIYSTLLIFSLAFFISL